MANEQNKDVTDTERLKKAAFAIEKLQARVKALQESAGEPIAITGMACRFPGGANSPEAFWELVVNGVDAVTEVPPSRWESENYYDPNPDASGKMVMMDGAFLSDVDKFDAAFFGISPEEAASMDPQQRLMLEVSWEALERAGCMSAQLDHSNTGVYIGIFNSDYSERQLRSGDPARIGPYTSPGNNFSIVAGRISYLLGLQGPSLAVDTACSSSLVALHLACQALRNRECDMAVVGSVNLVLSPVSSVAVSKMGMLSPTGRCRPFDAEADGFVRGEGAGAVVVKRLSDALSDGDNVLAVIRGSAVNQMGRSSSLTAPNGPAQEVVIKNALGAARLDGADIDYVEAHGTGSTLGDTMEANALGKVLCKGRPSESPLFIGSVKGNIGHAEAASGMAGVIKTVMALREGVIPRTAQLRHLNAEIPAQQLNVFFPTKTVDWPDTTCPRTAGVHSFGFSGSIAHLVLEQAPERSASREEPRPPQVLCLSSKSPSALAELVDSFADDLSAGDGRRLSDICYTANTGRLHFPLRAAFVAHNVVEMAERLKEWKADYADTRGGTTSKVAFWFGNSGALSVGDARELERTEPLFQEALAQCNKAITPLGVAIPSALIGREPGDSSSLERDVTAFSVSYAMSALWRSWGITPALVSGQGAGLYAAACVAGVLSVQDGLRLIIGLHGNSKALAEAGRDISASHLKLRFVDPSGAVFDAKNVLPNDYWSHPPSDSPEPKAAADEMVGRGIGFLVDLLNNGTRPDWVSERITYLPGRGATGTWEGVVPALAELYLAGQRIDWNAFYAPHEQSRVLLPTYRFQRERFWIEPIDSSGSQSAAAPSEIAGSVESSVTDQPVLSGSAYLVRDWLSASEGDREELILDFLTDILRDRLIADRALSPGENIDPQRTVMELGLQSLGAIATKNSIEGATGVSLPNTLLFDYPRITDLARHLNETVLPNLADGTAALSNGTSPEGSLEENGLLPVIHAPEERYKPFSLKNLVSSYFMNRMSNFELSIRSHDYFENDLPELNVERYERAWNNLIRHHEMLRAIVLPDGQYQILETVPHYEVKVLDLRGKPEHEAEEMALVVREEMCNRRYPLDRWPIFETRVTLFDDRIRIHFDCDLLILDYTTYFILNRDLEKLYDGVPLSPVSVSYRDYILTLSKLEELDVFQKDKSYWWDRIDSLPPAPEIPLKMPLASVKNHPGFRLVKGSIDRDTWDRVKENMREAGIQVSAGVASLFAEVLSAFSGTRHFTLNIMTFNRLPLHPEIGEVAGNLASTFLLEVDLREQRSLREQARRLQEQMLDDVEHHTTVTGLQVMQEINRRRGTAGTAPFPIAFSSTFALKLSKSRFLRPISDASHYNLLQTPATYLDHLAGENEDGSLFLFWYAVKEIFEENFLEKMMEAYLALVRRLADKSAWLDVHPGLTSQDDLLARDEANATSGGLQPMGLLHTPFVEQAVRTPDAVAVIAGDRQLTYHETFLRANQLAYLLKREGARPNTLVGVVMEKGWEQVVAVMGVLMAGAAYVPIDPELPPERIGYILNNGEVKQVLTQSWLSGRFDWPVDIDVHYVDAMEGFDECTKPLVATQQLSDLAYVIYTSGSTGEPKGVMISHGAAFNTIADCNSRFGIGTGDVFLGVSQLSFDLSVYDVFGALSAGASLLLPEAEKRTDPTHWLELVKAHGVTVWNSAPPLMVMLIDYADMRDNNDISSLRLIMLSGDWIPTSLPGRIRKHNTDVEIVSLGGATEASIWSILHPIGDVDPASKSIPYGKPMRNQTFHVLDDHLSPTPTWVPGELFIGGIGLADGYWKDPEKTDYRFFHHPETGKRLYRTGDKGRYLPDGNIEFLGRVDFQVKIQGYRIELGEIEAALDAHPDVDSAIVIAIGETADKKQLAAYVVLRNGSESSAEAISAFLREKLPAYMIPKHYSFLERFPISANGKIDRRALPAIDESIGGIAATDEFISPRTDTEIRLAELWEELLDQSPVGVRDNFFELGGQSFLAVRMVARIHQLFSKEIPLGSLFERPTIEQLALELDGDETREWSPLVPIRTAGEGTPLFFVHPVGGSVFCFNELAQRVGDRPFYAFQARGLDSDDAPIADFSEMAVVYIEAMRRIQPEGPYFLGGWSLGGGVALEMARQLRDVDEEVAMVAMIDSPAPYQLRMPDAAEIAAWFAQDLSGSPLPDGTIDRLRAEGYDELIKKTLQHVVQSGVLPTDTSPEQIRRLLGVFSSNIKAQQAFSYAGIKERGLPVALLRARKQPPEELLKHYPTFKQSDLGWREIVEDITILDIEGDHYTVLASPNVDEVAEVVMLLAQGASGTDTPKAEAVL